MQQTGMVSCMMSRSFFLRMWRNSRGERFCSEQIMNYMPAVKNPPYSSALEVAALTTKFYWRERLMTSLNISVLILPFFMKVFKFISPDRRGESTYNQHTG